MHEHELQRNALAKGEVLLVATSASQFANGEKTGAWLSEIAVPFTIFKRAGYDVTIASPQGGQVPVDDASLRNLQTEGDVVSNLVHTFQHDDTARQMMQSSVPLDKVEHVNNYRVVFLAGGHGATIDYPSTPKLQQIVTDALNSKDVVVAVVCHGSAVFASEQLGKAISGRRVTGFSDEEERSVGRDGSVPFLLESRLRELGANISVGAPGVEHVITDGNLMTGQNPASAGKLAQTVVSYLQSHPCAGAAAHPGTYTAEEVPVALGVAPLLPGYGSLAPPGGDTSQQVSKGRCAPRPDPSQLAAHGLMGP